MAIIIKVLNISQKNAEKENCWGSFRQREIAEYLKKGTRVMIIGDITIDTFQSEKTGKIQVSRNIFCSDVQIASMPRRDVVDPATGEVVKEDDGLPFWKM